MRHIQRQKLPLAFLVLIQFGTNVVEGCGVRPLQPYQTSQSQLPQSWFLPPTPVGNGELSPSASRNYQNPTRTNSVSSWSQLLTQAATHLQQFSFSRYNSLHHGHGPSLPAPSALRNISQPQKVGNNPVPKPLSSVSGQGQRITTKLQEVNKNCPPADPEKNKILVTTFYQQTFGDHNLENLGSFLHPNLIQHNPKVADGVEGLLIFLQSMGSSNHTHPHRFRTKMKLDFRRVSAEGDLVWVHLRLPLLGRQFAVMDLFRVECGKLVEHWDVVQEITGKVLASSKNGHPFF